APLHHEAHLEHQRPNVVDEELILHIRRIFRMSGKAQHIQYNSTSIYTVKLCWKVSSGMLDK
uniref:Glycosyltransferase family 92 protein n=1 Tax=Parascaris univalens TaxID=6257 RepID=A0A914ZPZ3_PARUN